MPLTLTERITYAALVALFLGLSVATFASRAVGGV